MRLFMFFIFMHFGKELAAQKRNSIHEKRATKESDLLQRKAFREQSKMYYRPEFFRISSANGFGFMNCNGKKLNIHSGFGSGIEMLLGMKTSRNFTLGIGFNAMNYGINQDKFRQGLLDFYQEGDFEVSLTQRRKNSLTKTALFFYGSYWNYRPKSILEFFGKCSITASNYNLNSIVLMRDTTNNFSAFVVFRNPINIIGVMPSIGMNYSLKLSSAFYFTTSVEYGYNFSTIAFTNAEFHTSTSNDVRIEKTIVPSPTHFVQLSLGITIKPFNRVYPNEKEYSTIDFDKNKIQNR